MTGVVDDDEKNGVDGDRIFGMGSCGRVCVAC